MNNLNLNKIFPIVSVVLLLMVVALLFSNGDNNYKDDIKALQSQSEALAKQNEELKDLITKRNNETKALLEQLEAIDQKIDLNKQELDKINATKNEKITNARNADSNQLVQLFANFDKRLKPELKVKN